MCTFIEDYLECPSSAIKKAQAESRMHLADVDDEVVYAQIASPEFHLYEAMIAFSFDETALQVKSKRLSL
jgi:hypothetical protein